ncbi:MAG: phosphoglucosamine mutase [Planctomycetota bacterium]|nr:phosphoglucosamine mutase [Planctomycetota bacterium]
MTAASSPQFFGTDGVRDLAGQGRLAPVHVVQLGRALARFALQRGAGSRVLLARDPRPSGAELVALLGAAMATEGAHVIDAGMLPSPALAWLTADGDFALGCAISASHNAEAYNGIKPFLADGRKLSIEEELQIEGLMAAESGDAPPERLDRNDALGHRYVAATLEALGGEGALAGLRLVVDLSAGAATATAPTLLAALGAQATYLHAAGERAINAACGSEAPHAWLDAVRAADGDGGLAFDGDADRVVVADEHGVPLDGDDLLAILATEAQAGSGVPAARVVSTVMANLGLEEYLAPLGVTLERTPVGDRHVAACMRATGAALGGEPAGHIVLPRADLRGNALVGDGLVAGVRVLEAARRLGRPLSTLRTLRAHHPQVLRNVRMAARRPLDAWPAFEAEVARQQDRLAGRGRMVIRYSGTEPLLRIMAEGPDEGLVTSAVEALAAVASEP